MKARLDRLWRVSLGSLELFFLPATGLLARHITWDGDRWIHGEPSVANTAAAAMALHCVRDRGDSVPLDPDSLLETALRAHSADTKPDERALILWADAVCGGRDVSRLVASVGDGLERAGAHTMTLAWSLIALGHCVLSGNDAPGVKPLAQKVFKRILRNQDARTGLFVASRRRTGLLRRLNRVASLSSQTYTIYALALYAELIHDADALVAAERCAATICRLQGPRGQWWWQYDVKLATVQRQYPVYGVNQHAAIPLALGTLQRALGDDRFAGNIDAGFEWLFGANEVERSLVDDRAGVTWRGVECHDGGVRVMPQVYSYDPARCLFALSTLGLAPTLANEPTL
jgi:hypothetical protein